MEKRTTLTASTGWTEYMIREFLKSDIQCFEDFVYKYCEAFFEDDLRRVGLNDENQIEIEIRVDDDYEDNSIKL